MAERVARGVDGSQRLHHLLAVGTKNQAVGRLRATSAELGSITAFLRPYSAQNPAYPQSIFKTSRGPGGLCFFRREERASAKVLRDYVTRIRNERRCDGGTEIRYPSKRTIHRIYIRCSSGQIRRPPYWPSGGRSPHRRSRPSPRPAPPRRPSAYAYSGRARPAVGARGT